MYIQEKKFEEQEIVLSDSYYPHEIIVLEVDKHDKLVPSHIRTTDLVPVPGRKIEITVAENGYIVKCGTKLKVSDSESYGNRLEHIIPYFLNKEKETEREITDSELEDEELIEAINEMNEYYQSNKDD